jgi:MerR family transcriptional regulator, light-induced transcriptional regulator
MTGLSQHAIRAWERRYGVVDPDRTGTNRRLYSKEDVERLILMKRAGDQGHSLATVAAMSLSAMRDLVGQVVSPVKAVSPSDLATAVISAMQNLDGARLENNLDQALYTLGIDVTVDEVIVPLIQSIDAGWTNGSTTIAQEHLASAVLRSFLHRVRRSLLVADNSRRALFTTLPGELHELGALIASVLAAKRGWDVIYLGPNMPPMEISQAATSAKVDMVGLSIVSPRTSDVLGGELTILRNALAPGVKIVVGGHSARGAAHLFPDLNLLEMDDLGELRRFLESPI